MMSPETRQRLREMRLGENNPNWKGDNVSKGARLHQWVRSRLPMPELCEMCNERPAFDLANVTGVYARGLENWKYYCRRCHLVSDGRLERLHGTKWMLGRKHSERAKMLCRISKLGEKNPRYGKTPWNKGKTSCYSDETITRMKEAAKLRQRQGGKFT